MDFLGKVLFPRQPAWQSRRQAIHLVVAVVVAIVLAAVVVAVMFHQNARR